MLLLWGGFLYLQAEAELEQLVAERTRVSSEISRAQSGGTKVKPGEMKDVLNRIQQIQKSSNLNSSSFL